MAHEVEAVAPAPGSVGRAGVAGSRPRHRARSAARSTQQARQRVLEAHADVPADRDPGGGGPGCDGLLACPEAAQLGDQRGGGGVLPGGGAVRARWAR